MSTKSGKSDDSESKNKSLTTSINPVTSDKSDEDSDKEEEENKFDMSCMRTTIILDSLVIGSLIIVSIIKMILKDALGFFLSYSIVLSPAMVMLIMALSKGITAGKESEKRVNLGVKMRKLFNHVVFALGGVFMIVGVVITSMDDSNPVKKLLRILEESSVVKSSFYGPLFLTTGLIYVIHGTFEYSLVCFLERERRKLYG